MKNAVMTERLVAVMHAVRSADHGSKQSIYDAACQDLQISRATLHRNLKRLTVKTTTRKQRSDAGKSCLTRDEALIISGTIQESIRGQGKKMFSLTDAVAALRANNFIRAERIDETTGEIIQLSDSAIYRALRSYGLHPDQLAAPDPHLEMRSKHPNHVWQIDASLCVLYYLKPQKNSANGLHVMAQDEFYKNKPKNLQRVMADRVWSYEITDHASGWIYVEYVMGAESGLNLCNVLINAMQERGRADLMHGVPQILYMDPGSANTSSMTLNLCKSLGIKAIAHAAGNARATGQVENARNIIERKFESGLRFRPVADLDELNSLAAQWRAVFNATAVHRRHKKNRSAMWLSITAEQLIKAPSIEVCRELAVSTPVERKVTSNLRINFQGSQFSVKDIPGVMVGEMVMVTRNPWRDDVAQLVLTDLDGAEVFHVIPEIKKDDYGFDEQGPIYGEGYKQLAAGPAQIAKAAIEQIMTGTETQGAAEKARKAKALPLGGKFNPYKPMQDTTLPAYMPRRGTEHSLITPTVEVPRLTLVQTAMRLRTRMGDEWKPEEHFGWLQQRYPDGAHEHELDTIAEQLAKPQSKTLRVMNGGTAC